MVAALQLVHGRSLYRVATALLASVIPSAGLSAEADKARGICFCREGQRLKRKACNAAPTLYLLYFLNFLYLTLREDCTK